MDESEISPPFENLLKSNDIQFDIIREIEDKRETLWETFIDVMGF